MSETTTPEPTTTVESSAPEAAASSDDSLFGTFDEVTGEYTPRQIVADDITDAELDAAYGSTFVSVEEGQMVNGSVVRIDTDEVLLDIGYKSEGVIPSRELSIRNDVDPREVVTMGGKLKKLAIAMVPQADAHLFEELKDMPVEVRVWGTYGQPYRGRIRNISPRAQRILPHMAFAAPYGGPLAVVGMA